MNYIGWIGAVLVLLGYYLNAKQIKSSWLIWIVGNFLVAIYCLSIGAHPTALMSLAIMCMNIYGYTSWNKKNRF